VTRHSPALLRGIGVDVLWRVAVADVVWFDDVVVVADSIVVHVVVVLVVLVDSCCC